ncbi:MAG: putative toxin-antitoxin system toxin component, PIN family [Lachnospiraceae bacterium]|nr:putative toxin-antitoxin system toxin component, PIN family [Ruminococcus sp.]MCM1275726.1 putative toxin-antitoxin system toxin component, PIN family [Lachnospiraceae bacterium]
MMYYAVIDTNVFVSALLSSKSDSATVVILDKIFDGEIIPVYNREILTEYREVLYRKKFHFTSDNVEPILTTVCSHGIVVDPTSTWETIPDMKDLPFYEVAMEKNKTDDTFLVTGNIKHFPVKPFIVTPREMLDIINSSRLTAHN